MPCIRINGVIWCKNEDEILKTAVKQHGENQWDLVASLLSGKTEWQCKDRWDMGLYPNLKKINRKTIASMTGRPTDESIGRYNYLRYGARRHKEYAKAPYGPNGFNSPRIQLNREVILVTTLETREAEENDPRILLPQARARFANAWSKERKRFARQKQLAVMRRLNYYHRIVEETKNDRKRLYNCNSENSIDE